MKKKRILWMMAAALLLAAETACPVRATFVEEVTEIGPGAEPADAPSEALAPDAGGPAGMASESIDPGKDAATGKSSGSSGASKAGKASPEKKKAGQASAPKGSAKEEQPEGSGDQKEKETVSGNGAFHLPAGTGGIRHMTSRPAGLGRQSDPAPRKEEPEQKQTEDEASERSWDGDRTPEPEPAENEDLEPEGIEEREQAQEPEPAENGKQQPVHAKAAGILFTLGSLLMAGGIAGLFLQGSKNNDRSSIL